MTQFIKGKTYSTRSACDYNCIWTFTVMKRTACFVWLKEEGSKEIKRRKVSEWNGVETCSPHGKFSMSPILKADAVVEIDILEQNNTDEIIEDAPVKLGYIGDTEVDRLGTADDYSPVVEEGKRKAPASKAVQVTASETDAGTVDGLVYEFTRSNIDYSIFFGKDDISVYRTNHQRGGQLSMDCYRDGTNHEGKPMSKLLENTIGLIMGQPLSENNMPAC